MTRKQRDRICRALSRQTFRGVRLSPVVLCSGGIQIRRGGVGGWSTLSEDLVLDGRAMLGGSPTEIAKDVVRLLEKWALESEREQRAFVLEVLREGRS